jgi:hypothetical protein
LKWALVGFFFAGCLLLADISAALHPFAGKFHRMADVVGKARVPPTSISPFSVVFVSS